jgi:hypothetical protein
MVGESKKGLENYQQKYIREKITSQAYVGRKDQEIKTWPDQINTSIQIHSQRLWRSGADPTGQAAAIDLTMKLRVHSAMPFFFYLATASDLTSTLDFYHRPD